MSRLVHCLFFCLYFLTLSVWANPSVLLLNPGKPAESFWSDVDLFAEAAAKRLDLPLTIYHADRSPFLMIKHIEQLIAEKRLPDYLILVNEKQVAPKILRLLEGKPVYVVLILNALSAEQQVIFAINPHWQKYLLASLIPDNYRIGFSTARALHKSSNGVAGDVVIISGDKTTPASIEREAGARDYFNTQKDLNLRQVIYGDWQEALSFEKSKVILARYPNLKYIWTANDHSAFGSLKAVQARGLQPGKDIYISTINTSNKVLNLRESNEISVLGGGHFTAAGWALVMIKNHQYGYELAKQLKEQIFHLIKPDSFCFKYLVAKDWSKFPFTSMIPDKNGNLNFLNLKRISAEDRCLYQ